MPAYGDIIITGMDEYDDCEFMDKLHKKFSKCEQKAVTQQTGCDILSTLIYTDCIGRLL